MITGGRILNCILNHQRGSGRVLTLLITRNPEIHWKAYEQVPGAYLLLGLATVPLKILGQQQTRSQVPACSAPFVPLRTRAPVDKTVPVDLHLT